MAERRHRHGYLSPRFCDFSFRVLIDSKIAGIHLHSRTPARVYEATLTSSRIYVVGTGTSAYPEVHINS